MHGDYLEQDDKGDYEALLVSVKSLGVLTGIEELLGIKTQ